MMLSKEILALIAFTTAVNVVDETSITDAITPPSETQLATVGSDLKWGVFYAIVHSYVPKSAQ